MSRRGITRGLPQAHTAPTTGDGPVSFLPEATVQASAALAGDSPVGFTPAASGAGLPPQTNLVAWYDASYGITKDGGNRISAWNNRIPGDANMDLAQGTAGVQPLWNSSDVNLNNQPSVTFSKARSDWMASGTWNTPMPNTATWIVIGRVTTLNTTNNFLIDGIGASNRQFLVSVTAGTSAQAYAGNPIAGGTVSAGDEFVMAGQYGVTEGKLWYNAKTAVASGNAGVQTALGITVGRPYTAAGAVYHHDGEIAEILGYNSRISQATIEAIFDWVSAKYGIVIGA